VPLVCIDELAVTCAHDDGHVGSESEDLACGVNTRHLGHGLVGGRNDEIAQLDIEGPAFFLHGLSGIGAEVAEDLLNLGRVCEDRSGLFQGPRTDGDRRRREARVR